LKLLIKGDIKRRTMNSKLWIRKALSMCLMVALIATYSMVALASDGKAAGEIVITGNTSNDESSVVTVNGEPAQSGRTIFSSSTITTPEGSGAIVSMGKAGRIEIAPHTTFALSFDDKAISGDLSAGSITVLSAAQSVGVTTLSGEVVKLNAGDTVAATSASSSKAAKKGSGPGLWWIAILGGAVVAVVLATQDDSNLNFGSGTITPVSPTS
jgi:hypothetical protein